MKKIISGIIIAILLFLSGFCTSKYFFPQIRIIEKKVYKTVYKEIDKNDTESLFLCYKSPIMFRDTIDMNYLYITAFDDCKSNTARYQIGTKGNWKMYVGFGVGGIIVGIVGYNFFK